MAAMTVAMLPTPWMRDRFGFRRVFLIALLALALTSVAGSLSPNFTFVVCARILQGAAAGILQPMGVLAVMRLFSPQSQGKASGVLSFSIVLAPAVAPALGGVLLDHFGWQAIFLINLPFCLVTGIFGLYWLPLPREIIRRRFDWLGVGLLTLGTLALVEGVVSLQQRGLLALRGVVGYGGPAHFRDPDRASADLFARGVQLVHEGLLVQRAAEAPPGSAGVLFLPAYTIYSAFS